MNMPYRYLSTRRDGAVAQLRLNRPDVRNAFNEDLIAEMTDWALATRADRDIRVAVLSGEGAVFSAGGDANWMAKTIAYSKEENLADATAAAEMFAVLDALPAVVIGRIHGGAFGGGAGLAAICDVAVAEENTMFGFTEVRLGLIPAVIAPFVLRRIGLAAARELFLTGARFPARRAQEIGLIHAVVPAAAMDSTIDEYIRQVLASSPEAVIAAKTLIRDIFARPLDEALPIAAHAIATQRVSPAGQEGLRAFLDKRKPSWQR